MSKEGGFSYPVLRRAALDANSRVTKSPCGCGKGNCCTREVEMSRDDGDLIKSALRAGTIPDSMRCRAAAAVEDPFSSELCPFQQDDHTCGIYEQRPIVCIIYGAGGFFKSTSTKRRYFEEEKSNREKGLQTNVLHDDVVNLVCEGCESSLKGPDYYHEYPFVNVVTAEAIAGYFDGLDESDVFLVSDFVKRELSSPVTA